MSKFITAIGVATLIMFAPLQTFAADTITKTIKKMDTYTEKSLKDWGIPGASIAIVKDGKIVFTKGFGLKTMGGTEKVDSDTVFAIGSISKSFTTAALAVLVTEGKIKWDDKVVKHLPSFELFDPKITADMTIRDLVAQRTCMQATNLIGWGTNVTRPETMKRLKHLKQNCAFRSDFVYNNLMFVTAGEIVAAVSGQSWDDYIQSTFFDRLGMTHSTTRTAEAEKELNLATAHSKLDGVFETRPLINLDAVGASGSIHSSAHDMAIWTALQLNKGTYNGIKFWDEAASFEMHRAQMIINPVGVWKDLYPESQFLSYGLGWFTYSRFGDRIVGHGGQTDAMVAGVAMMPDENVGIIVLTNSVLIGFPEAIAARFFDAYKGRKNRDWSTETKTELAKYNELGRDYVINMVPQIEGTKPTLALNQYVGNFHNDLFGDFNFKAKDDGSVEASYGGRTGTLFHYHNETFGIKWHGEGDYYLMFTGQFVTFDFSLSGKISAFRLNGSSEFKLVKK